MFDVSAFSAFTDLLARSNDGIRLRRSLGKYLDQWVYFGVQSGVPGLYIHEPKHFVLDGLPNKYLLITQEEINLEGVPQGNFLKLSPIDSDFDLGLFSSICDEFVRFSDSIQDVHQSLVDLLTRWSKLLNIASASENKNALVGLFGELLCLREMISKYGTHAVLHWTGPDSARHDFEGKDWALEVKSSTILSDMRAVIHGVGQLESAPGTKLSFVHYQLEWSPGSLSLGDLVGEISGLLEGKHIEAFHDGLKKIGFDGERIKKAEDAQLKPVAISLFDVDKYFPRITKETLGKSLDNILRVDYWIKLDGQPKRDLTKSFDALFEVVSL